MPLFLHPLPLCFSLQASHPTGCSSCWVLPFHIPIEGRPQVDASTRCVFPVIWGLLHIRNGVVNIMRQTVEGHDPSHMLVPTLNDF